MNAQAIARRKLIKYLAASPFLASVLPTVMAKSFWPRVYSISNTDIPIHLASSHCYMFVGLAKSN